MQQLLILGVRRIRFEYLQRINVWIQVNSPSHTGRRTAILWQCTVAEAALRSQRVAVADAYHPGVFQGEARRRGRSRLFVLQAVVTLDLRSGATQVAAQAIVTLDLWSGATQLVAQATVTLEFRSGATQLAAQAVVTLDLRSGATQLAAQAVVQLDSGLASPSCLLKLLSH